MSKLFFKDDEYSFGELWRAYCTKKSVYKTGEVIDMSDGESIDISELPKFKAKYLDETMNDLRDLGVSDWSISRKLKSEKDKLRLAELELLYSEGRITVPELKQMIELKYDKEKLKGAYCFSSYMFINTGMPVPDLSNDDLGKFYRLCHLHLTHDANTLRKTKNIKSNGVNVKLLGKTLGIKDSTVYLFLSKLEKVNLLKYIQVDKTKFMVINPMYLLNGKLSPINYMLFKESVDEHLSTIPNELKDLWEMEFRQIGLMVNGK